MSLLLHEGDMREVLAGYPSDHFDCVIADPPYNQTALVWDRWPTSWLAAVRRVLKPSGSLWVFGTLRMFMDRAEEFGGWRLAQDLVWEKQNGTGFDNQRFRRVHEQAAMFYRSDAAWSAVYRQPQFTYDAKAKSVRAKPARVPHAGAIGPHVFESVEGGPRLMRSVLAVRNCHRAGSHPTQKPEALIAPLVRYSCPPGGLVLDPFAGSGVTGMVARELALRCVLIEGDGVYARGIRDRLSPAVAP